MERENKRQRQRQKNRVRVVRRKKEKENEIQKGIKKNIRPYTNQQIEREGQQTP